MPWSAAARSAASPRCAWAAGTASPWRSNSFELRTLNFELERGYLIKTVGVIGAATMGNGIAQVFAHSGFNVKLFDVSGPAVERALGTIAKSLGKFVEKQKMSAEDRDAALGRLSPAAHLDSFADVDY